MLIIINIITATLGAVGTITHITPLSATGLGCLAVIAPSGAQSCQPSPHGIAFRQSIKAAVHFPATEAAGKLQQAGLIDYRRGHIAVPDRPGLEARVRERYRVVKTKFDRLLPSLRRGRPAPRMSLGPRVR